MSYSRRLTAIAAALLCALLVVAESAHAQYQLDDDGRHLFRIGVAGGLVVPTANTRAALESGVQAQAFLLVNALRGVPLRFNLGYQKFDLKHSLGAGLTGTDADSGSTRILAGVVGTQIDLLHGPVRPYVTFGVGGFNVASVLAAATNAPSSNQLKFGIDGGAGLVLKIGRLDAFVEGHLQKIYSDRGMIDLESIQAVPVSFGVLF